MKKRAELAAVEAAGTVDIVGCEEHLEARPAVEPLREQQCESRKQLAAVLSSSRLGGQRGGEL